MKDERRGVGCEIGAGSNWLVDEILTNGPRFRNHCKNDYGNGYATSFRRVCEIET